MSSEGNNPTKIKVFTVKNKGRKPVKRNLPLTPMENEDERESAQSVVNKDSLVDFQTESKPSQHNSDGLKNLAPNEFYSSAGAMNYARGKGIKVRESMLPSFIKYATTDMAHIAEESRSDVESSDNEAGRNQAFRTASIKG